MWLLKLMERETGGFRTMVVTDCSFRRLPQPQVVINPGSAGAEVVIPLSGDAFLLNPAGDTIEKFFITERGNKP